MNSIQKARITKIIINNKDKTLNEIKIILKKEFPDMNIDKLIDIISSERLLRTEKNNKEIVIENNRKNKNKISKNKEKGDERE